MTDGKNERTAEELHRDEHAVAHAIAAEGGAEASIEAAGALGDADAVESGGVAAAGDPVAVADEAELAHGDLPGVIPALLRGIIAEFPDVEFTEFVPSVGPIQSIAHIPRDQYREFMTAVRDAGYRLYVDTCGVDYLRRHPRFEVVTEVVSIDPPHRLRVRVAVPGDDPTVPSLVPVYPGAGAYERETYDLYGILFEGHPDLTRILLPDDWVGHPLRKDYSVGSVPVQFKGAHKAT